MNFFLNQLTVNLTSLMGCHSAEANVKEELWVTVVGEERHQSNRKWDVWMLDFWRHHSFIHSPLTPQMAYAHDSVRVLQCFIQFSSHQQRLQVYEELKGERHLRVRKGQQLPVGGANVSLPPLRTAVIVQWMTHFSRLLGLCSKNQVVCAADDLSASSALWRLWENYSHFVRPLQTTSSVCASRSTGDMWWRSCWCTGELDQ